MPKSEITKICDLCGRVFYLGGFTTHAKTCEKKYGRKSIELQKCIQERPSNKKEKSHQYYIQNKDRLIKKSSFNAYYDKIYSFSESAQLSKQNKEQGNIVSTFTKNGNTIRKPKPILKEQLGVS